MLPLKLNAKVSTVRIVDVFLGKYFFYHCLMLVCCLSSFVFVFVILFCVHGKNHASVKRYPLFNSPTNHHGTAAVSNLALAKICHTQLKNTSAKIQEHHIKSAAPHKIKFPGTAVHHSSTKSELTKPHRLLGPLRLTKPHKNP